MARTCSRCGVSPVQGQSRHAPDCPIKSLGYSGRQTGRMATGQVIQDASIGEIVINSKSEEIGQHLDIIEDSLRDMINTCQIIRMNNSDFVAMSNLKYKSTTVTQLVTDLQKLENLSDEKTT